MNKITLFLISKLFDVLKIFLPNLISLSDPSNDIPSFQPKTLNGIGIRYAAEPNML